MKTTQTTTRHHLSIHLPIWAAAIALTLVTLTAIASAEAQPQRRRVIHSRQPESETILRKVDEASVRPSRWSIALNVHTSWQRDDGYRLFDDNRHVTGGGLSAGYRILDLSPKLSLQATAEWYSESSSGNSLLGTADMDVLSPAAGLILRHSTFWWLSPFVRAVGGVAHGKATVFLTNDTLRDTVWAPFGTAAVGLSFLTRRLAFRSGSQFHLSLDVEGGFTLGRPLSFDMKAHSPNPDSDAIPLSTVPLGSIDRTRPHMRISLSAHF